MALASIQVTVDLTEFSCGRCGGVYAINERVRQTHERDGTGWHCPYCQSGWGYFRNGTVDKLRQELAAERERHQRTIARVNEIEADKAKAERKLKRVRRGVCPQCNRTFGNLARHMACKHGKNAE